MITEPLPVWIPKKKPRLSLLAKVAKRRQDREIMLAKISKVTRTSMDETRTACSGFYDLRQIYRLAYTNGKLPS